MNIFDTPPPSIGEIHETLFKQNNIEISHIVSSSKLPDIEYDQEKDEFAIILEGAARLEIEGREVCLKKGEHIFIKAHTKHRVLTCDNGTRWLAVYMKN
jgi:cupin 2 domain-containing protein